MKMKYPCFFLLLALVFCASCKTKNQIKPNNEMPPKILWAWERPEDLRFLDAEKFGVAFLAQTLILQQDDVVFRPRRQPLELPPNIYLIAVTRIETQKNNSERPALSDEQKKKNVNSQKDETKRPALSDEQRKKIVNLIKKSLELPNVKAIQTDFDVVVSERKFYRALINDLKKELPENTPLTITSLASWCIGDNWFNDFPVDEAVPMAFEMGADDKPVRDFLTKENDWREPLCRGSYGISMDDPLNVNFKPNRRFYYFKSKAWEKNDLEKLK